MAHFAKPPSVPAAGYDVDNRLAPGSIWRVQVPLGGTRDVALCCAAGLWVRSNNRAVVPNNGFRERQSGSDRILTLFGGSPGTSMLETGQGGSVWVALQVQVVRTSSGPSPAHSLPLKTAFPNPINIKALEDGLTSVIAGHPQSIQPWTFYEELDRYLGPWGTSGYPISYGKFYCIAFNSNKKLMANPQTAEWVRRTTIALQEPLRNYVIDRFKKGTLGRITEPELRQYAFNSHPAAYTQGGLAMVILVAPELLPVIATIPGAAFDPRSDNFSATIKQVFVTLGLVTPGVIGNALGAMAGPAHTGILSRAVQTGGMNQVLRDQALGRNLSLLLGSVQHGELDDMNALNAITARLNATEFPDQGFAAFARQIVDAANVRKGYVARTYRALIQLRPELQHQLDKAQPGWSNW